MRAMLLAAVAAAFVSLPVSADDSLAIPGDQQTNVFILPMDDTPEMRVVQYRTEQQGLNLLNRYDLIVTHPGPGWRVAACNSRAWFDLSRDYGYLCQIVGEESVHHLGIARIGSDFDEIVRSTLRLVGYGFEGRELNLNKSMLPGGGVEYRPFFEWRERGQLWQTQEVAFGFYPITFGQLAGEWALVLDTGYPEGSAFDRPIDEDFAVVRAAIRLPDPLAGP